LPILREHVAGLQERDDLLMAGFVRLERFHEPVPNDVDGFLLVALRENDGFARVIAEDDQLRHLFHFGSAEVAEQGDAHEQGGGVLFPGKSSFPGFISPFYLKFPGPGQDADVVPGVNGAWRKTRRKNRTGRTELRMRRRGRRTGRTGLMTDQRRPGRRKDGESFRPTGAAWPWPWSCGAPRRGC